MVGHFTPSSLLRLVMVCMCMEKSIGFFPPSSTHPSKKLTSSSWKKLHLFGKSLGDAFKNDKSLGKPGNAGLNKNPNVVEVTINGKPVKAVANQKVSQVAAAARVPIQYSCRKGDCATCSISMNGRIVKACQEKIPDTGKCVIQTL